MFPSTPHAPATPSTGESGRCLFPARCLLLNVGQQHTHTQTHTHSPSPGSIGCTQCSWRPLTPDTSPKHPTTPPPPHTTHTLQPGEGPITPTGGIYPESPSCLEWYLQGLQVLSSHYVCSITCPPPLNTHQPPLCSPVCTTIPPIGLLLFHFSMAALWGWERCVYIHVYLCVCVCVCVEEEGVVNRHTHFFTPTHSSLQVHAVLLSAFSRSQFL